MTVSRRSFLSRGSVGIAIAGALATVPGLTSVLRLPQPRATGTSSALIGQPLVAHVRDMSSGEVSLMVGTDHVIVRDTELAARLYGAALMPPAKEK